MINKLCKIKKASLSDSLIKKKIIANVRCAKIKD